MERETLLTILLLLFGGVATQLVAMLPQRRPRNEPLRHAEHRAWIQLWMPVMPTLFVGAWLCGWALQEPDPVRDRLDGGMLVAACLPFAIIAIRALMRAIWSLLRPSAQTPVYTVGFIHPRIVFSPFLARKLDEGQLQAVLAHERAHVRHRDPLRIWLAQLATDLQWPWPWAHRRFTAWLEVLELTRDEEARRSGASGVSLATAILATIRQLSPALLVERGVRTTESNLIGDARTLQRRITRLLAALPADDGIALQQHSGSKVLIVILIAILVAAYALGTIYGESVLHPFFALTWSA